MTAQTQQFQWPVPPNPAQPGTPEWEYNEIMRFIEPDLMTSALPHLAEYYASETPAERHARFSAYQRAFIAFDDACRALESNVQQAITPLRTVAEELLGADDLLAPAA